MEKKYWFISEFYWPMENSTGHIITRIIDAFTKKHEAHIITTGNRSAGERNEQTHTIRIPDYHHLNKNNLVQRIIKLFGLSGKMAWMMLKNVRRGDVVITVTNPTLILIFLGIMKIFKDFKLIILVHDIFPENLIVTKIIKEKSFHYKVTRRIFSFAYDKADMLIVCGRDMQATVKRKVKDENKVIFIPNFGDTDTLFPISKKENPILKKLNIVDALVVLFAGNIGRMQGIENIVEAADLLVNDPEIVFLFIGEGACLDKIKNHKRGNIFWLPSMERDESKNFLNAGDIGLSSLMPNMMGTGVPSKTYSYMATGKPIIAVMDSDSEIALMVQEEGNGWVIEPNKPEQLAKLLRTLKLNKNCIRKKGEISLELSRTKYSANIIIEQYVHAIEKF
jgi:glycosyltransferase involved in cell wall biosynthesis